MAGEKLTEYGGIYVETMRMLDVIPLEGEWARPAVFGDQGAVLVGEVVRAIDVIERGRSIVNQMKRGEFKFDLEAVARWGFYYREVLNRLGVGVAERQETAEMILERSRRGWMGLLTEKEKKELGLEDDREIISREDMVWARRFAKAYAGERLDA